jgi:hypothetical protein
MVDRPIPTVLQCLIAVMAELFFTFGQMSTPSMSVWH